MHTRRRWAAWAARLHTSDTAVGRGDLAAAPDRARSDPVACAAYSGQFHPKGLERRSVASLSPPLTRRRPLRGACGKASSVASRYEASRYCSQIWPAVQAATRSSVSNGLEQSSARTSFRHSSSCDRFTPAGHERPSRSPLQSSRTRAAQSSIDEYFLSGPTLSQRDSRAQRASVIDSTAEPLSLSRASADATSGGR